MKKNPIKLALSILVVIVFAIVEFPTSIFEPVGQWEVEYQNKKERRANGFVKTKEDAEAKAYGMREFFEGVRNPINGEGKEYPPNYLFNELNKAKQNKVSEKSAKIVEWVSRGPGNVGGRARGLIVDPDDPTHNTWFVGSATGGIWKTTDGGSGFTNLTPDIPYLSTSTLAMAPSNSNVIYAGTGESFSGRFNSGGGIFKSTNKGQSWQQLSATAESPDFRYVNRIIIDPTNENIVVVATYTGIFKTQDGGASWQKKYTDRDVEDLDADPSNFMNIYASINSKGVLKSTDAGETWIMSSDGIGVGYRFELAIAPTNPDKIYVSAQYLDTISMVYLTNNAAESWEVYTDNNGIEDFLGGQGWYDNTIVVDPYDENTFFVGGVDIWKLSISDTKTLGEFEVTRVDENNTQTFIERVNFNGNTFKGVNVSDVTANGLIESDWGTVEIRFGKNIKQKAYRFEVPFEATSGVSASNYTYKDFVEVPFEVWDVTNNKQLSVSFRDQERDGAFNLYGRAGNEQGGEYGLLGREYLYISAEEYNANGNNSSIATTGGHKHKNMHMLWLILPNGGVWSPEKLPESNIRIVYSQLTKRYGNARSVADSYNNYGGGDNYKQSQGYGKTNVPGFHPDHHNLVPIKINDANKEFWLLNANDGGVGISKDNGENWLQRKRGLVTTQVYAVAKKQGEHKYFCGLQDNGSWQSPAFGEAIGTTSYLFRRSGDGFECIWHQANSNKIMASIYNNQFFVSNNAGVSWTRADKKIDGDGPFISRLSNSPNEPDRVYAVGKEGLWLSEDFGASDWQKVPVGSNWVSSDVQSWHNVEISPADNNVIYCGAANSPNNGLAFYASQDKGETFVEGKAYDVRPMGYYFRSITPHPNEKGTVYVSYAVFEEPKILRSRDYGQTWEDLSGYGVDGTRSTTGFPEVPCNCLLIFPEYPNQIWAGTDIGIFESKNHGGTWEILETDMPAAPITQLYIQDGNVVVATYGRGIWTVEYDELVSSELNTLEQQMDVNVYPNPSKGDFHVKLEGEGNGDFELLIYDMSGRLVYSEDIKKNVGQLNTKVQLLDVKSGNYNLVVRNQGERISKKIVISK